MTRQERRVGEKLFVDYAGQTVPVIDRHNGEIRQAQVFVAVLGASSYTFAEATWSQQLPGWLSSHAHCFTFLGGVPDNLRSAVSKSHRYEPGINPSYRDLAEHYGVAARRYVEPLAQYAGWNDAIKAQRGQVKLVDEDIDHAHWIGIADLVVEAFRK